MKDINAIVAANLKFFMERPGSLHRNPYALGKAAGVAPNTVSNILNPKKRTTTTAKPVGYPNLDKLVAISAVLGCEVWELLHPDIERSLREREMYRQIERDFMSLPKAAEPPVRTPSRTLK